MKPMPVTHKRSPNQFLQKHWQKLLAAVFWILALGAYLIYTSQNDLSPIETLRQLIRFTAESPWGVVIFIGLYILRPIFLFSAGLLTIASGVLFGPIFGVLYTVIGANIGASLAYFIGRFFGQDSLDTSSKTGGLQNYIKRMRENSFETVFIMRLIFLPYDLVNYLAGFLRINYGAFILATILGSLPGTISFALFGASAGGIGEGQPNFDWRVLAASVAIFLVSLLISRLVKRREKGA